MFRRQQAARTEAREAKFKEPRTRRCRSRETHVAEHTHLAKIIFLSRIPSKRKTMYRSIIELSQSDLDQNIYILCDMLLHTLLDDAAIDRLFYTALGRILRSPKSAAVKEMCADYLLAQLAIDRTYTSFLEYLLRHCSAAILPRKAAILEHIDDPKLHRSVSSLCGRATVQRLAYTDPIYCLTNTGLE